MNTAEGNKLIAEFMGGILDKKNYARNNYRFKEPFFIWIPQGENYPEHIETLYSVHKSKLQYHSSWNWLMPVVEKIRNDHYIEISFYGDYNKCLIICTKADKMIMLQRSLKDNTTIEIVWQAVIQFLEWYNKEQSVQVSDTTKA
jgi:hypothetical protein